MCIIPLLHMVAIPATIESATRLKCRNNVLLSTEGCRDQTAPFSFSLLFPVFLDSVIKEHGGFNSIRVVSSGIILLAARDVNMY